jgi:hypothetical protein
MIFLSYIHLVKPCTPDGSFLTGPVPNPESVQPPDATTENPWAPFPDRLAFDWAQYHYVWLQSLADEIHKGLDIWHATVIKHETEYGETDHVPWRNAQDLYETLDSIKAGGLVGRPSSFAIQDRNHKHHLNGWRRPMNLMLEMSLSPSNSN